MSDDEDGGAELVRSTIASIERVKPYELAENLVTLGEYTRANNVTDIEELRVLREVAHLLYPYGFRVFLSERRAMTELLSKTRAEFDQEMRDNGLDPDNLPPRFLQTIRLHSGGNRFPLGRELTKNFETPFPVPE